MPLEKILTLHVVILIRSIFNKNQNDYYYSIFLEKCLYQLDYDNSNSNLLMADVFWVQKIITVDAWKYAIKCV